MLWLSGHPKEGKCSVGHSPSLQPGMRFVVACSCLGQGLGSRVRLPSAVSCIHFRGVSLQIYPSPNRDLILHGIPGPYRVQPPLPSVHTNLRASFPIHCWLLCSLVGTLTLLPKRQGMAWVGPRAEPTSLMSSSLLSKNMLFQWLLAVSQPSCKWSLLNLAQRTVSQLDTHCYLYCAFFSGFLCVFTCVHTCAATLTFKTCMSRILCRVCSMCLLKGDSTVLCGVSLLWNGRS